ANGQKAILEAAIAQLGDSSKELDKGWAVIQEKTKTQTDLMKEIASAPDATTQPSPTPSAAGKSIAVKATLLAQTIKEADEGRAKAAELLDNAIKNFEAAVSNASTAGKDMSELADRQASMAPIVKIAKNVLAPQVYKLQLATAERVLAESAA